MQGRGTLLFLFALVSGLTQSNPPSPAQVPAPGEPQAVFGSDTNLVLVRFQMTPKKGQPSALRPEDLELREDGIPQKIAVFQGGELYPQTVPVEVNLLFAGMRGVVDPRTFRLNFSALDDHERVSLAVWAIGEHLVRLTPPTRDAARLDRARNGLMQVWSTTGKKLREPLFGAIAALAREAARGRTNVVRMLVVVSNGEFAEAEPGAPEAIRAAKDAGIAIFPVLLRNASTSDRIETGADGFDINAGYRVWDYDRPNGGGSIGRPLEDFESLAKATNGRLLNLVFQPPFGNTLDPIFKWLRDQIKFDCVAGFYPVSTGERTQHKIQVILKDANRGQLVVSTPTVEH